jgi:hypothetical protein
MPDPSKKWKHMDYSKAYMVLSQLKSTKPLSLPRKESKKSGQYFDRLISLENLSFLENDSIPLFERAYQIQSYILIHTDLTDVYTDVYKPDQYYHRELIDLYLFGLSITHKMLGLSHKINESDDAQDKEMQSGFRATQNTYLMMVSIILEKQKNSSVYEKDDLKRLTDSLYHSINSNRIWMEVSVRNHLKQQLRLVKDQATSDYIKNKYNQLLGSL